MSLFGRTLQLVVGDLDVSGLRCAFTIEKHLRSEPNTGKISVWNMSKDHRRSLEERADGVPVRLEAGLGEDRAVLFQGLLDVALSEKDGPDWVTNIYTDDGKDAVHARGAVSYRGGVNVNKIAEDLAKEMGVGVGNLLEALKNAKNLDELGSAVAHGFASKGGPADALYKLLNDVGLEGSVQDGELQVLTKDQPIDPVAVVLRRDTGLVGTPAVDRKGRLEARALLISGLKPGASVQVESVTANGLWRLDAVTYVGDTHGQDWYAEIEGQPLS